MGLTSAGGYATSPSDVKVLMGNIERLAKRDPLTAGGGLGRRDKNTQVVESGDPAATVRQFWAALSKGGQIGVLPRGKGDISYFEDGSRIFWRRDTRSISPRSRSSCLRNEEVQWVYTSDIALVFELSRGHVGIAKAGHRDEVIVVSFGATVEELNLPERTSECDWDNEIGQEYRMSRELIDILDCLEGSGGDAPPRGANAVIYPHVRAQAATRAEPLGKLAFKPFGAVAVEIADGEGFVLLRRCSLLTCGVRRSAV